MIHVWIESSFNKERLKFSFDKNININNNRKVAESRFDNLEWMIVMEILGMLFWKQEWGEMV